MKRIVSKYIFYLVFPLIFLLGNVNTAKASHIMGGDITYSCISNGQYAIQVKLFRDCNGISLGNSITVNMSSATCGTFTVTLPLISTHPQTITPTCPGTPDVCDGDPGASYGIEEYIYKGNIDMNAPPINGCQASDWTLSWSSCCRNSAITTLQSPGGTGTYLYANLDNTSNTSPCNSSPDFLTRPTAFFCLNEQVFYNHGVTDPDGDSLAFSLTNCLEAGPGSVTYSGGLSGTNPLIATGLSVNPNTGAITFVPTAIQVGVLCVLVKEYRNGILIGETIRDMQFRVLSCPTNPPVLAGVDSLFGGSFDTTICADDFLQFNIQSSDADSLTEKIQMYWNGGISGGSFVIDSSGTVPNAVFSWTPSNANAGINTFTVTVEDDACPLKAQNIFTYTVFVLERPPVDAGPSQVLCGLTDSVTLEATIDNSQVWNTSPISYRWSPVTGLSHPDSSVTSASPDSTTEYTVLVTYSNGCSSSSSVVVEYTDGLTMPALSDTAVCLSGVQLDVSITNIDTSDFFFENTSNILVPDNDPITGVYSDITVSGVSPAGLGANSIVEVCFAANHFFAGDVDVFLISPNGDSVELTTDNGGIAIPGAYSDTTCFSMSAASLISASATPYSGTYIPEGDLNDFNGSSANGLWRLWIRDDAAGAPDSLTYFSMTFSNQSAITYSWSPTDSLSCSNCPNPYATPIQTTTYTVIATDQNGCTAVDSMTIFIANDLAAPTVFCSATNPNTVVFCWDSIPGALGYEISLDTGLTWITSNTGTYCHTVTGLAESTDVQIMVRGISPCLNVTIGVTTHVCTSDPCTVVATLGSITDASCPGLSDGAVTVNGSGGIPGVPGYTYILGPTPLVTQVNDGTFTGLPAGNYFVAVADSFLCGDTVQFTINQPTIITSTMVTDSVSCVNGSDGTATVTAAGGAGGFSYLWDNADTTAAINGLVAGTYIVTITDANNCTLIDTADIGEPDAIVLTVTSTNVTCFGANDGTITISAIGGSGAYIYSIDSGMTFQSSGNFTSLPPGNYQPMVTNADGTCGVFDATVTITENPELTLTIAGTNISCDGGNDGTATVTPMGGTGSYTYLWDAAASNQITQTATNLPAGTFNVTVTDTDNCSQQISITLTSPPALAVSLSSTDVSCFNTIDGTVDAIASGGVSPYSYQWASGATPSDSANTMMAIGMHTVTVTDANGCTVTGSVQVNGPLQIALTTSSTNLTCNGSDDGTAFVSAMNGAGGYTYLWSNGDTTAAIMNLPANTYTVTVTDINGCTETASVTITEPVTLTLSTTQTNVSCFGGNDGTATVTGAGGTLPYTYFWDNGDITPTTSGLSAGTASVTVTDGSNCSAIITVTITQPSSGITASLVTNDVSCNGGADGSISTTAVGGAGGYTYNWSSGHQTPAAGNLQANTYSVTITDANGCFIVESATISEPTPITLIVGQTATSCNGGNDGTATVVGSGGTPNSSNSYTFVWNTVPPQFGTTAIGLSGGQSYTVIATDVNGCTNQASITVGQPDAVTLTTTQTDVTCDGYADGQANVIATGGIPGYTYSWDNGNDSNAVITNVAAGTYNVTVTDFNGCNEDISLTITEPSPVEIALSVENVLCKGESTGKAMGLAAGGTPFYNFAWDDNARNQNGVEATGLAAGTYVVTLTDAQGCALVDSISITEPAEFVAATMSTSDVSCFGERDGGIIINAEGGVGPYEYSSNGVNWTGAHRLVGLTAGKYEAYVRDFNGCEFGDTVVINEPAELLVDAGPDVYVEFGEQIALVTDITNGVLPYTFDWSPPTGLSCADCPIPMASPTVDEYYTFTVTDANGCTANDEVIVRVDKVRRIYVASAFSPNNDGVNDALFIQGGVGVERVVNFQIYDRWGELVFHTSDTPVNDPDLGWDGIFKGQKMNSNVYGWSAEILFSDGEVLNFSGNTTLVR